MLHYYFLANNSPPYQQIIPVITQAFNWGVSVMFAVTGILLALSIANYLFRRDY
jgi:hypothetical protein